MKFIMLVGLPGSGKTHFGNELGFPFFDDLTQNGGVAAIKTAVQGHHVVSVVVSDFSFIFEQARNLAVALLSKEFPGCTFQWEFWENDLQACLANLERRADGRVISQGYMEVISKMYTFPAGCFQLHPVYSPGQVRSHVS